MYLLTIYWITFHRKTTLSCRPNCQADDWKTEIVVRLFIYFVTISLHAFRALSLKQKRVLNSYITTAVFLRCFVHEQHLASRKFDLLLLLQYNKNRFLKARSGICRKQFRSQLFKYFHKNYSKISIKILSQNFVSSRYSRENLTFLFMSRKCYIKFHYVAPQHFSIL